MTEKEITETVKMILINELKLDKKPEDIKIDSHLINDLGLDDLDDVMFVMALEEEYNIEISEIDAQKLTTIKDAVKLVKEKLKE